jgi:hypothetical protein
MDQGRRVSAGAPTSLEDIQRQVHQ